jgi:hypothetical protein
MPAEVVSPAVATEKIEGIPLYLIPKTISDQIRQKRESVFQITVERRFHHRYRIIVETIEEHADRVKMEEEEPAANVEYRG